MSHGDLEPIPRSELRASHEDRDAVVDRLRVAAGDGRLDADELDERIEAALGARTYGELDLLVKDLPAEAPGSAPGRMPAFPGPAAVAAPESQVVNIAHGKAERHGPWVVPQRLEVHARHGVIVLDFTEALFSGPRELLLDLDLRHSVVRIIAPGGAVLEEDNLERRHSVVNSRHFGEYGAGHVRIVVTGRMTHSTIGSPRMSGRRVRQWRRAIEEGRGPGMLPR